MSKKYSFPNFEYVPLIIHGPFEEYDKSKEDNGLDLIIASKSEAKELLDILWPHNEKDSVSYVIKKLQGYIND